MDQSNIVIDVIKLLSGVHKLEYTSLHELLEPHNLDRRIYYRWRDVVIDTESYILKIDSTYPITSFPELPSVLDKDMFNMRKLYKRRVRVEKQLRYCAEVTRARFINAHYVPNMLSDYYHDNTWTAYQLAEEATMKQFTMLMVEIEKELPWLHETNILMQTL